MNDHDTPESIAIVGMAGRFPQASNLAEFWQNLRAGKEAISFFKDEQIRWLPIEHPPRLDDPRFVKARAVLEKAEWFDAGFFHINPKEAEIMDPQHRVFLECCWEALENAGCNPDTHDGLIGVFAGASMNTYLLTNLMTNRGLVEDFGLFSTMIMNDGDFVPTRVSYKLNLRGPSINIQTACSTSLVAVCIAAQNLLGYRCDVALAGGVSITFPAQRGQHHLEGGILSNDGHCRAFDAQAAGTVLGDGAGVVVLKRLSDALADGDHIHAVIKGTAINNDGAVKIGYTAPSVDGQAECIAMAQSEAGVTPDTISYIEAHGTGTPLGDPIEIAGLTKAFGLKGERGQFCAVGSVKSNIGHLDIGAGIAGLIKTVLALEHEEIPPSLHFSTPNPKIDFQHSPFFVADKVLPWPSSLRAGGTSAAARPRRAGVSSFGIGGTNAHAVLEEAPLLTPSDPAQREQLLVLSARSATALDAATDNLAAHLQANPGVNLADVAFTLQTGRKVFGHRRAVVVRDAADAVAALTSRDARRMTTAHCEDERQPVAFLFPGQGAQAVDMARGLYDTEPAFKAQVDRSCEILRPLLQLDLRTVLFPADSAAAAEAAKRLTETRLTQPALFVIEHALAQLWIGRGIRPQAMIGHSLGEYVAACLAGVFSLEDALALVAERARLMQAQPAGAMTAVRVKEAEVAALLTPNLALAAVNAPGLCVVSGPFDEIEALEQRLAASAITFKRLATSHAFHSAMMDPVLRPFAERIRRTKMNPPSIRWVSNVSGKWITPDEAVRPEYWTTHLRRTVRFADGISELIHGGFAVLLEVGPGTTLAGLARQHPAARAGAVTIAATLGAAKDKCSDAAAVLQALGQLWIGGVAIDWRGEIHREARRRIVPLPTYPFERKPYFIQPGATSFFDAETANAPRPAITAAEADVARANHAGQEGVASRGGDGSTLRDLSELFHRLSGIEVPAEASARSFYELGFDSLFLTQASQAVSRRFGVDVTFRQLREDLISLTKLAAHIDARRAPAAPAAQETAAPSAPAAPVPEIRIPLTDAQRELWFASQMGASMSAAYIESTIVALRGPLAFDALGRAVQALCRRHESLRTTFAESGEEQRIATDASADLSLREFAPADEAGARAFIEDEVHQAFDLLKGPLLRVRVARLGAERHLLAVAVHHIICDGWSLGILMRELAVLYSAEKSGTAPVLEAAPRFSEYAPRQAAARDSAAFKAAESHWIAQFADSVPMLELPLDRPRPVERTHAGGFVLRQLAPEVAAIVRRVSAENQCTAFTVLLGAFSALLHRLTGQDDVVVGVPSAAQVMDGADHLVGHFANLLPVRSRLEVGQPFADFLVQSRQQMDAALEHWRYPFGTLLQKLNLARDPGRVPLAPVVFNMTRRRGVLDFADLAAEVTSNPKRFVNFDLNFNFALNDDALSLGCYFSTELFDEATIVRWIGHFETLLRAIGANPDGHVAALPLLNATEREQMLVTWNDTALTYPRESCVHELFERQARRTPDAVAVVAGRQRVTYAELNRRADDIAAHLRAAGVGPDVLVGVFLERTPRLLAAVLGVLKAGGAYVPLDPAYPLERLEFILGDTAMPVVITQPTLQPHLPTSDLPVLVLDEGGPVFANGAPSRAAGSRPPLKPKPAASNLAYVIYTSGSTGKPKGVCLEHRGVVALIAWAQQTYRSEELAGVLYGTSVTFDVSVFESLVPLSLGGKIILAENILQLGRLPAATEVTLISGVPSAVAELIRGQQIPSSVRTVNVAGEPCPQSLVEALYALPHIERVVDVYGPTETTVYSTGSVRERGGRATIGRPLPNEQAYVLDRNRQPVPIGVPGELYLGGDKLARGYLNRPELTRDRFVEVEALPGRRLYRTGDNVRFLPDGRLEYIGRLDHQVKVRGFRIELGEVEGAFARLPGIAECVVVARPDPAGNLRLLAYVVPNPGTTLVSRELRESLLKRLPDYMVPSAIVVLTALPRTASGKIDRAALPAPDLAALAATYVAPRTTTEQLLAEMWREVLDLQQVGVHDNFFELGGHSLLATQVISRIHDVLNVTLSMRQFFTAPSIAGLAPVIEACLIADIKSESGDAPPGESGELLATAQK